MIKKVKQRYFQLEKQPKFKEFIRFFSPKNRMENSKTEKVFKKSILQRLLFLFEKERKAFISVGDLKIYCFSFVNILSINKKNRKKAVTNPAKKNIIFQSV